MLRFFGGGHRVASSLGGLPVDPEKSISQHVEVHRMVTELSEIAKLTQTPKVYVIPTQEKNAFAAGFTPDTNVVAVTDGLLKILTKEELRAVLAHEVGHLANGDTI